MARQEFIAYITVMNCRAIAVSGTLSYIQSLRDAKHYCEERLPSFQIKKDLPRQGIFRTLYFMESIQTTSAQSKPGGLFLKGDPRLLAPSVWYSLLLPFLAQALEAQQQYLIESSAVAKEAQVFLLTGRANHGKAATAWYMGQRGFTVLSTSMTIVDSDLQILDGTHIFRSQCTFLHKYYPEQYTQFSAIGMHEYITIGSTNSNPASVVRAHPIKERISCIMHIHIQDISHLTRLVESEKKRIVLSSNMISRFVNIPMVISPWRIIFLPDPKTVDLKFRQAIIMKMADLLHYRVFGDLEHIYSLCRQYGSMEDARP